MIMDNGDTDFAAKFSVALEKVAQERIRAVQEQREEILEAFIAKYGYEPDQLIQVEAKSELDLNIWTVRVRSAEEIELMKRLENAEIQTRKNRLAILNRLNELIEFNGTDGEATAFLTECLKMMEANG